MLSHQAVRGSHLAGRTCRRTHVSVVLPAAAARPAASTLHPRALKLPGLVRAQLDQESAVTTDVTEPAVSTSNSGPVVGGGGSRPSSPINHIVSAMELLQSPGSHDIPQSLIDAQLAHLIESHPHVDDIEEVVQQLPFIKAELADQQQLLAACNQFLEDMAERHMDLLLQQASQRVDGGSVDASSTLAASVTSGTGLQTYTQLEQRLQQATEEFAEQQKHTMVLIEQKDTLNKQLRMVTMEREELRQQLQAQADAALTEAERAQLAEALQRVTDLQGQLSDTEQKLTGALDTNRKLTEQLTRAKAEAEAAKAEALAATSSATAATYAQLQEVTAKAAALEAQLAAAQQHNSAVCDSNKVLQLELQQSHAQGKRLIALNKQLMQHVEAFATQHQQQQEMVTALQADKAAMAAKLGGLYVVLQDMQDGQQRQQHLQVQLLDCVRHIVADQQQEQGAGSGKPGSSGAEPAAAAAKAPAVGAGASEEQQDVTGNGEPVSILAKAVTGAAQAIVGPFLR